MIVCQTSQHSQCLLLSNTPLLDSTDNSRGGLQHGGRDQGWNLGTKMDVINNTIKSHDCNVSHSDLDCLALAMVLTLRFVLLTFILIMAMIKCPGCSHQFDSNTGLTTHKCACKAKITAIALKLLEACKVNDTDKLGSEEEIWIDEATLGIEEAMPTLVRIFKYQIQLSTILV